MGALPRMDLRRSDLVGRVDQRHHLLDAGDHVAVNLVAAEASDLPAQRVHLPVAPPIPREVARIRMKLASVEFDVQLGGQVREIKLVTVHHVFPGQQQVRRQGMQVSEKSISIGEAGCVITVAFPYSGALHRSLTRRVFMTPAHRNRSQHR